MFTFRSKAGFTLLEILIALFIFTLVAMIITGAMHNVFNAQTNTDKSAARLRELQIAVTLLSRDMEQIIDRPVTNANGALQDSFSGSDNTVTFTHGGLANPLGQLPRSTLQRTQYHVEKNTLLRETWPVLDLARDIKPNQRKLLSGVTTLQFQYLDKNGKFQERWPPTDQTNKGDLPCAIQVTLTLNDLGKITQLYIIPGQKFANTH